MLAHTGWTLWVVLAFGALGGTLTMLARGRAGRGGALLWRLAAGATLGLVTGGVTFLAVWLVAGLLFVVTGGVAPKVVAGVSIMLLTAVFGAVGLAPRLDRTLARTRMNLRNRMV